MNKFPDFYRNKSLYVFYGFQGRKSVLENWWSGSENNLSRQKSNFLSITFWHCALTNPESMKVELSFKHHKGAIQFKISLPQSKLIALRVWSYPPQWLTVAQIMRAVPFQYWYRTPARYQQKRNIRYQTSSKIYIYAPIEMQVILFQRFCPIRIDESGSHSHTADATTQIPYYSCWLLFSN